MLCNGGSTRKFKRWRNNLKAWNYWLKKPISYMHNWLPPPPPPNNVYLLKASVISPSSTSRPTSPCAAHVMDSLWYGWTWVALTQKVIRYPTLNLRLLAFQGCLKSWVVANLAQFLQFQELVYYRFLKNGKTHIVSVASIRSYTEPEKIFHLVLFDDLCWWPQRKSILRMLFVLEEHEKENFSISAHKAKLWTLLCQSQKLSRQQP